MKTNFKHLLALTTVAMASNAMAEITFYEREGLQGRSFTTERQVDNFERSGFNDRASSALVTGERWMVCEDPGYGGRCALLRPGRYPDLSSMALNNRVSSVREVNRNDRIAGESYSPAPAPAQSVAPQITFYEQEGYGGKNFSTRQDVRNLNRAGFNDSASSIDVVSGRWEVCADRRQDGPCIVLRPGRYPSLAAMGLNDRISSLRRVAADEWIDEARYAPLPAVAQVTFYEQEQFGGRSFTTQRQIDNFNNFGFNDRASSVDVTGTSWEVCDDAQFRGRCFVLRPGRYPSLAAIGLSDRISSVRNLAPGARVSEERYARPAFYDARVRGGERLFEANVISARAVVGPAEKRCWVEREQIPQEQRSSSANVPAALAGAVIGGILGHQVGGGRGKDLATIGGLIAGGAFGSTIGRDNDQSQQAQTQDVQRCTTMPNQTAPALWDVTYIFRGQEQQVQMTIDPGATVTVNERGEPRARP